MARSFASFLLLLSLFVLASVRTAAAQPANYKPLLDEAVHEFSLGHHVEAMALFREVQKIWPSGRALRAIGRCQFELGDHVGAYGTLQQALSTGDRPLDGAQRKETEHLLGLVRERIARYTVVTEPPYAQLTVDGAPATLDELGGVMLSAGPHTFEATATGFMPATQSVVVQPQYDEHITMNLAPLVVEESEPVVQAAPMEAPSQREDKPLRKKWWLWTSVAGAVAVAAVATVLIVKRDDPEPALPSGGTSGIAIGVPSAAP